MEVIIQQNPHAASLLAARYIAKRIQEKPDLVLGLTAGQTPLGMYRELVRMHKEGDVDFSRVTAFVLDEFVGVDRENPASHFAGMQKNLFEGVNIPDGHIHHLDGKAASIPDECKRYEALLREKGGIDIQVLGIGPHGHIGFNEPTSSLASRTRTKTLTPRTRKMFARGFGDESKVPHYIVTMGIGTILDASECLLMAFSRQKASVIAQAVEGPITSMMPASALQLHPQVKIFLDEEAASLLKNNAYYRWVFEGRPDWQKF